ncbi:hypothetical protein FB45DRAFT_391605 [Roridomyces roridus]|uniref:Uncharacterized protein n=1 Tax=Roridomyces roridus TaxID=1738132 RepID=A0AAD7B298_9AGAR|nr:hypothetical protein FB45DRAFT_391605 [Roridomyces roridus]
MQGRLAHPTRLPNQAPNSSLSRPRRTCAAPQTSTAASIYRAQKCLLRRAKCSHASSTGRPSSDGDWSAARRPRRGGAFPGPSPNDACGDHSHSSKSSSQLFLIPPAEPALLQSDVCRPKSARFTQRDAARRWLLESARRCARRGDFRRRTEKRLVRIKVQKTSRCRGRAGTSGPPALYATNGACGALVFGRLGDILGMDQILRNGRLQYTINVQATRYPWPRTEQCAAYTSPLRTTPWPSFSGIGGQLICLPCIRWLGPVNAE